MDVDAIFKGEKEYLMQSYLRYPAVLEKGKGVWVWDSQGKKYLDCVGGVATVSAGHGNAEVSRAVSQQVKKVTNVTNLYYTKPQVELAKKLAALSGLQKTFFCNSGTEANEAALKLARAFTGKTDIISCEHAFHGRTFGSLSATWKEKFKKKFEPLVPGFSFVPYGDAGAIEMAITEKTAAAIIEPIQGEAGVIVPEKGYLKKVSGICKKNNILLIVDEVQTGNGRTGKFFCFQHEAIVPDIVTAAKGLGNGIPIGACIAKKGIDFSAGDHGATFGGNNVSCAAALATIGYIRKHNLMGNAAKTGDYFKEKLTQLKKKYPFIESVSGMGLMLGMKLKIPGRKITEKCLELGLLVNCVNDVYLRFLPPLVISTKEVDIAVKILYQAFHESGG